MARDAGNGSATSPSVVLSLVRSGRAASRAEVARETGLSATTASARVDALIRRGLLQETGAGPSRGGRPPRRLEIRGAAGLVATVLLGEHGTGIALFDAAARLLAEHRVPVAIADGPETVLAAVAVAVREAVAEAGGAPLLAVCVGVPGPVSSRTGLVVSPARMPGWNGADVATTLRRELPVPVLVENDANLMALGEHAAAGADVADLVFVTVGAGIGCGVIADGHLYRGGRGFAGDISHVTVPDAPPVPCSCGRVGCLDAVASGTALAERLQSEGVAAGGTDALLSLAHDAHPLTTRLLREAGARTGSVLSTIVNFADPERLVIGGDLSAAEAFVAGVRSAIYAQCPPMITEGLEIAVSRAGQQAVVLGAGRAALDLAFSPGPLGAGEPA